MRRYLFADESGCLAFTKGPNVSRYFILCTITSDSCQIGYELLELKRQLAWEGHAVDEPLHATTDKQIVRDRVFDLIQRQTFRVDATILEKSKAQPQVRHTEVNFYQYAWFYHFKNVAPNIVTSNDELFLMASSLGTRKKKAAFSEAINNVTQQCLSGMNWRTTFWPAQSDPCLQIADYCAWAIQRKWEKDDDRSYRLIQNKIVREYDLWSHGSKHYY